MAHLSLVLIVKNESTNLAPCLDSAKDIAAEIVILDAGSTDDTLEIAKKYTDKIFVNNHWQGFGKQRQIAQSYASEDWVLMLDADERLTPELANEIRLVIDKSKLDTVYNISRLSWAFGDFIRHGGWYPDYVARLYPKDKVQYNDALVHEKLVPNKSLRQKNLTANLLHYTYEDLEHYLVKSAGYAKAWAAQRYSKGKKSSIFQGLGHGVWWFFRMYILKAGFLDGKQGLLLALLSAHSVFAKYVALWEMNQVKKD